LAVSCGDDDPAQPPDSPVESIDVTPANAWLTVGGSLSLSGLAKDADGEVIEEPLTWSSSDTRIASVSANGVVQAVAIGTATITAQSGDTRTTSAITVTAALASFSWSIEHQGITDVSLLGTWADPTSNLAVGVGQLGVIMESTGSGWQVVQQPTAEAFTGVWGTSASNAFAVGTGGVIFRRTATGWSRMPSPTTNALLDVWGSSATEAYAVGTDGTVLRWDGASWSVLSTGRGWELWGIWGSAPNDLWMVGQNGVIVHYDGNSFTPVTSPTDLLILGLWGSSASDIWAVGISGRILH
jgi:hypothetical protein